MAEKTKKIATAAFLAAAATTGAQAAEPTPIAVTAQELKSVAACHYDARKGIGSPVSFVDKRGYAVSGLESTFAPPLVNAPGEGGALSQLTKNGHPVSLGGKPVQVEFGTGKSGGCSFTTDFGKTDIHQMKYQEIRPMKISEAAVDLNLG